ncbi:MAG: DUF4245 family protein [Dermatophilaceae bacterium]
MTSPPEHPAAPDASPGAPAPGARQVRRHGGNSRSLVISMVIMTALVFAFVALLPRPAQRERAAVDAVGKAGQIATDQAWPVATSSPGDDWRATSVALTADAQGVPTWTVGYHHRPGDDVYVTLAQTQPSTGAGPALQAWVVRQTKNGREDGTVSSGGRDWSRRSSRDATGAASSGDAPAFRSLVAQGPTSPGGLATVIAGDTSYEVLERFAGSLTVADVPTGSVSPSVASPARTP